MGRTAVCGAHAVEAQTTGESIIGFFQMGDTEEAVLVDSTPHVTFSVHIARAE